MIKQELSFHLHLRYTKVLLFDHKLTYTASKCEDQRRMCLSDS